jgi:hypothetical protein
MRFTRRLRLATPCSRPWCSPSTPSSLPVLEGKKDNIRELKHDFNAPKTYKDWLPQNSHGGTCQNLQGEVKRAFERIKGAISQSIGSRLALTILTELHRECMMHFSAIFITKADNFYCNILGKSGRPTRHPVGV